MFQDVLLETTAGERHRRELTLLATLAGEALVVAALVALPLLYLDAIPGFSVHAAPVVDLTYHAPLPPTGDPGRGRAGGRSIAIARPTDEFVVPRTIADPLLIYNRSRQTSDDTVPPNVPLPRDCCGGGGHSGSDLVARAIVPAPPARPPLISHVEAGMIVRRVEPVYPTLARQAHIQGDVVLRVFISQSGQIEDLRVVSGHPFLTQAAADAVEQWRFRPYYLNGSPIEVEAQITVRFVLGGGL